MPIRFACTHCGQRLSVGSHKAGQTAACPKCKASLTVPSPPPEPEPSEPEAIPEAPPLAGPPLNFGGEVEIHYERSTTPPPRTSLKKAAAEGEIDFDRVAVPRYVIFAQGILLAVVALVCFLLGMAVGGAVTERSGPVASTPATVNGVVAMTRDGNRTPDGGSTIIFLPFEARPEEKIALEGVRPGDDPAEGERVKAHIRQIGGALERCDARGEFSLQLPERGRYYMLTISSNTPPSRSARVDPKEIAQIGRYFNLVDDPLKEYRYQWRLETIRGNQRANVTFD